MDYAKWFFDKPEKLVSCEKCEEFHIQQKKELPCLNYEEGEPFMIYDGAQHELCYQLIEPKIVGDSIEAFNLWQILSDDRTPGMGPSTIRTESIIFLCSAIDETWEMFLKIKAIEKVFFDKIRDSSSKDQEKKKLEEKNKVT